MSEHDAAVRRMVREQVENLGFELADGPQSADVMRERRPGPWFGIAQWCALLAHRCTAAGCPCDCHRSAR